MNKESNFLLQWNKCISEILQYLIIGWFKQSRLKGWNKGKFVFPEARFFLWLLSKKDGQRASRNKLWNSFFFGECI